MGYQKIINSLGDTTNEQYKFRKRNQVEINDESRRTYNDSNQIKFKTLTIMPPHFCDQSDAYIHVTGIITVPNTGTAVAPNNRKKPIMFKNSVRFTN